MLGGGGRRDLLDRIQGTMGVIEGHAEHVLDVVGADALPSLAELRSALDRRRRERSPLLALLERLIGLDAKLRQYEDGKRFCDAVVAAAGSDGLHRVFEAPEHLPTLAELHDPDAWMARRALGAWGVCRLPRVVVRDPIARSDHRARAGGGRRRTQPEQKQPAPPKEAGDPAHACHSTEQTS